MKKFLSIAGLILTVIFTIACNDNPTAPQPPLPPNKPQIPPRIVLFTVAWVFWYDDTGHVVVDQDQTKIGWIVKEVQNLSITQGANVLYTFSTPLDRNGVQEVQGVSDSRIFQTPDGGRVFILTVSNSLGSVSQTATIE